MQGFLSGWRKVGFGVVAAAALSSCLLTSNFDGLTGGKVPPDGGAGAGGGAASSSAASSGASSSTGASGSGGAASSSVASSSSGMGAFPSTKVLDDFNRADGPVGGMWLEQSIGSYEIAGNQLSFTVMQPGVMLWPTVFGPTQEAFITFEATDNGDGELELILKSQGAQVQECESLQVDYKYPTLHLYRCTGGNFIEVGSGVMVMFAPGDQLGARADDNGKVEAFKNGVLLQTWDATAWPFYKNGGRIGWGSYDIVAPALLDDFGGG